MNSSPGCVHFTRPISAGQNSSAGAGTFHVRENTSLVISIAMSQRSPSHCAPTSTSVSATALRSPSENASSCTTSGHGGKYGSRPRATIPPAVRAKSAGRSASSSSEPGMKYSGCDASHGWSGATWFGT